MIVGIGTDLLEVARMERELRRDGRAVKERLFTPAESAYCEGKRYPPRHFAARFAAKEALVKALPAPPGAVRPLDVEVLPTAGGRPQMVLHGAARALAERAGVRAIFLSLTHTRRVAAAQVVLES